MIFDSQTDRAPYGLLKAKDRAVYRLSRGRSETDLLDMFVKECTKKDDVV